MTEDDARRVLLLRAFESPPGAGWTDEDRAWATRQALATLGEAATPSRFVATRASLAMTRLLPREPEAARWLERRGWHPLWPALALLLGLLGGVAVDQLGPPQRVNLLAPAVWAVVLWNLAVYVLLWLPAPRPRLPWRGLAGRLAGLPGRPQLHADWLRLAAPLLARRTALVWHLAAAGLALGLVAGLYLRGLLMDYRAGWQSTFLDAATVQALLQLALAPASAITGIAVPAVAPLQLAPGGAATASAAPWIHLFAASLVLAVVLPRLALAGWAAWCARRLSRQLPLDLADDYFEALHPLMRPASRRPLTLLWCPLVELPVPARLLGQAVAPPEEGGQRLFDSGDGDGLLLLGLPPALRGKPPPSPWWRRWFGADPTAAALRPLRPRVDAVLQVAAAGGEAASPPWLAGLSRPLLLLQDADRAAAPTLPLRALDDGWLADGLLWQALAVALPDDRRRQRLEAAWRRRQRARLDDTAALMAASLARLARACEPLPEARLFGRGEGDAQAEAAARERLLRHLDEEFSALERQLVPLWGRGGPEASRQVATVLPRMQARVPEGRAALWGGVVSGTLAGLKADLASGGLTLGAGAVAGGVIGALGAAGVARGFNSAQGRDRSQLDWGAPELLAIATAMLRLPGALARGPAGAAQPRDDAPAAEARLQAVVAAESAALAAAWRGRGPDLEARLAPLLARLLEAVLGRPADYTPAP